MINLDAHDSQLAAGAIAAIRAAIAGAHRPAGVAKKIFSAAAGHRNNGRAAAIRRYQLAGNRSVSNRSYKDDFCTD